MSCICQVHAVTQVVRYRVVTVQGVLFIINVVSIVTAPNNDLHSSSHVQFWNLLQCHVFAKVMM